MMVEYVNLLMVLNVMCCRIGQLEKLRENYTQQSQRIRDNYSLQLERLRESYTCLLYTSPSPRD